MPYVLTDMPPRLPGEPYEHWLHRVRIAPLTVWVPPADAPPPRPKPVTAPRVRTSQVAIGVSMPEKAVKAPRPPCTACHEPERQVVAKGLCVRCLNRARRRAAGKPERTAQVPVVPCPVCGRMFKARAHGSRDATGRRGPQRTCSVGCGQTLRQRETGRAG